MSDPTELLEQMRERSAKKLNDPKNLVKESWYEMTDEQVRNRIIDEMFELAATLRLTLTVGPIRNPWDPGKLYGPIKPIDWNEAASEAADIYHFASMGADPRRKRA